MLQNRSAYFTLDPRHPNRLEPRKRPLHTLIASLAFRDDKLWQVLGCMGADGQPQIHVQTYVATIDFGLDIQQAVEMPRWLSGRFSLREPRDLLQHRGALPGRDTRRARAARPRPQPLGRLARARGTCARDRRRSRERSTLRWLRSAQRWGGDRVLDWCSRFLRHARNILILRCSSPAPCPEP